MHWKKISEHPLPKEHNKVFCLALDGKIGYFLESWVAWRNDLNDYVYVPYASRDMKAKKLKPHVFDSAQRWRWNGTKELADWMV